MSTTKGRLHALWNPGVHNFMYRHHLGPLFYVLDSMNRAKRYKQESSYWIDRAREAEAELRRLKFYNKEHA